jgi:redox-sensitive bicupin YhaK (pirin superfamily)
MRWASTPSRPSSFRDPATWAASKSVAPCQRRSGRWSDRSFSSIRAGPAEFLTGQGVDVRPHPHIGLGTVTYLYRGDFHHRDSTGADQIIRPGELNWMVAGRGVSHSERTSAAVRSGPNSLFGIRTWLALPERHEDMAPMFEHHGREALPVIEEDVLQRFDYRRYGRTPSTFSED